MWLAKICCGLKYEAEGLEKLPKTTAIVVTNHQSFWDQMSMQLIIPKHSWVLKRELFIIPLLGWGLRMVTPIAVGRGTNSSVAQILGEGQEKIKEGLWLIIFPESTKVPPDRTVKFKLSAVKLGSISKVRIVMMVHNAGLFWPSGFWFKQPGSIKIKIISVIEKAEIEQTKVRILNDKVEQIINSEKQKLIN